MTAMLALVLLHGDSVSSSTIEVSGREARVTFLFSMADLSELARLDQDRNGIVDPAEWTQVLPAIFAYLSSAFQIEGCRSEGDGSLVPPATAIRESRAPVALRMRYVSARPLDRLKIRCALFREHEGNSRHVVEGPGGRVVVFDRERAEADLVSTARAGLLLPWSAGAAALLLAAGAVRFLTTRAAAA